MKVVTDEGGGRDESGVGVGVGCNSICTRQFNSLAIRLAIDLTKYTIVHPTFIYRKVFLQENLQIVGTTS